MISDPAGGVLDPDAAMRRRAMAQLLQQRVSPEAFRTPAGTAGAAGIGALNNMMADPRFMNWIMQNWQTGTPTGQPARISPVSVTPETMTGMLPGPR